MKKVLVVIGVAVLMAAVAAPASAQFKSWGSMQIAGTYIQNQDFNNGGDPGPRVSAQGKDKDLSYTNIWQRFNFFLQYGDPKTVRAVIGFEAESTDWGESATEQAAALPGNNDFMGSANTDKNSLGIKWAFIEFMVPNTPLQITAGIQPFAYGGRLVEGQDSMGLSVATLFAPHKITAMWYRRNDDPTYGGGYAAGNLDGRLDYHVSDIYALKYDLNQKAFDVQAYFAFNNDLYSGRNAADPFTDRPWWIGANATFRPGNWTIYGQFVYKGGERDYSGATQDRDYKAWAAELEVKYKIGPGMSVIGELFYATGNDADATDEYNVYSGTPGNEASSNFGLRRSVFMWENFNEFGNQHHKELNNGGGFWYARAAFEYAPTSWLNLILNYLYIGDTAEGTNGLAGVNGQVGASTVDEDFVGHEINLIANLKIYQTLMLNIGVAAFLPGDVYELPNTATTSDTNDTAYMGVAKLVYAF